MRIIKTIILAIAISSCAKEKIAIVVSADANTAEKKAAEILKLYCEKIYSGYSFSIDNSPKTSYFIEIGLKDRFSEAAEKCTDAESFCVYHDSVSVTIAAHDERGLLNAVYAQLEKLGCGFYLTMETLPAKKKQFLLQEWEINDRPLTGTRIVFNWHNFLSGCTSWNLPEWKQWISQSSKMRFNTIMVHAYGNNPMFRFSHNGIKKESGYIASTKQGRDWGTEHVNDVRNLWGGAVFDGPVFGADVAMVPEEVKEDSAIALMQRVFDFARAEQMNVCFAFDIATNTSNPQPILKSLPSSAVIPNVNGDLLIHPEHPEGLAYIKSQVQCILNDYPQITLLAPWIRLHMPNPKGNYQTPAIFPQAWEKEYNAILKANKELTDNGYIQSIFYIGKVMKAYRNILDTLGRKDIKLCIGTWHWDAFAPMDKFISHDVTFIPIDWFVNFDTEETLHTIQKIDSSRNLIPIVWAHHDDHKYIGKPYTPYSNFVDLLKERNADGYGIIHWTTRPLDIYFKSLSNQVWEATYNEPLKKTTYRMAQDIFETNNSELGNYLYKWIITAPMMGRETTDYFYDFNKTSWGDTLFHDAVYDLPDTAIIYAQQRLELLKGIQSDKLTRTAKARFDYFKGMEDFYFRFFNDQKNIINAYNLCKQGLLEDARKAILKAQPEETIKKYAEVSSYEITPGEKGVIVALNTKWLPDFIDIRQRIGLEPYHYKFCPTQHEPLAQGEGLYSFFFNDKKEMALCKGRRELRLPVKVENNQSFIQSDTAFSITLSAYRMRYAWATYTSAFKDDSLTLGKYKLNIYLADNNTMMDVRFVTSKGQIIKSTKLNNTEYEFDLMTNEKPKMTIVPKGVIKVTGILFQKY